MPDSDIADSFKRTKHWQYMLDNFDEIDRERKEFNDEFSSLLNSGSDEMAVVLKCHLIVEYYINEYLSAAFPSIGDINKLNLRFVTKIDMANNEKTIFGFYQDSLRQFNTLRNKFAHNLSYTILDADIERIRIVMDAWNVAGGYSLTRGTELIRQYTMWLSASINATTIGIRMESSDLGIAGYLKWLEEMQGPNTGT